MDGSDGVGAGHNPRSPALRGGPGNAESSYRDRYYNDGIQNSVLFIHYVPALSRVIRFEYKVV